MADAMTRALRDETGSAITELRADGGASAMDLLLQLQADQLQLPVARPRCVECSALGAAMLAALAEGVWDARERASRWEPDVRYVPRTNKELADLEHAAWLRALDRSRSWARPS
jgi:glycerol kinase